MTLYYIFLGVTLILSLGLVFVMISSLVSFVITAVPFIPSPVKDVRTVAQHLGLSAKDHVYDLGSGNGRVLFEIESVSGARTTGYELMRWTHIYARTLGLMKHSRAQFIRRNFLKENLSTATVVYCYLYPHLMTKVGEKVMAECKPGTTVVSRDFRIPNLIQTDHIQLNKTHEVYIYVV